MAQVQDSSEEIVEISDEKDFQQQNGHPSTIGTPSLADELATLPIPDEPPKSEPCAKIQFRMPDGSRIVRRFPLEKSVKTVYAFVFKEIQTSKTFELKSGFPPRDLLPNINDTVESCRLNGESITVRWKQS